MYGMMIDKMGTSLKNKWMDENGHVYIVYPVAELQEDMVFLGLMIAHFIAPTSFPWPIVLTLSAIASATAPAATVLVIRQYHAHDNPFPKFV